MAVTDNASAALFSSPFASFAEDFLDMGRDAAKLWLDACEQTLEAIAGSQEQAATQTDIEWLATAARTQAKWVREIATRHVAVSRELLN
jgi:hypothetical protein